MMAIREKYIEKLVELFKSYMKSGHSLESFEEIRYQASELGKELFKERIPLDWIVGLYIEAVRRLKFEVRKKEALDLASCGELLLEMVMAYSVNFLRDLELRKTLRESDPPAAKSIDCREFENKLGKHFHSFYK